MLFISWSESYWHLWIFKIVLPICSTPIWYEDFKDSREIEVMTLPQAWSLSKTRLTSSGWCDQLRRMVLSKDTHEDMQIEEECIDACREVKRLYTTLLNKIIAIQKDWIIPNIHRSKEPPRAGWEHQTKQLESRHILNYESFGNDYHLSVTETP